MSTKSSGRESESQSAFSNKDCERMKSRVQVETRTFHTLTDYELSDFQTKRPSAAARVEINSNISESRTGDSSTK